MILLFLYFRRESLSTCSIIFQNAFYFMPDLVVRFIFTFTMLNPKHPLCLHVCTYVCTVQHRHVFNRNRCSNYSTLCKGKWRAFSWKWEVENVLMRLHFDLVSYSQKQMHTFQSRNIFSTHRVNCHFCCSGQTT